MKWTESVKSGNFGKKFTDKAVCKFTLKIYGGMLPRSVKGGGEKITID